nr:hypothetical protein 9 [Balneolaceae bacterium]
MKPVPQTIQLGAFTYAIKRFDDHLEGPAWTDTDRQEIWLRKDLHPQQATYWLLHEIMEIRLRELDGKDVETADLTRAVLDIWAQNPEVVAWIMAGLVDSKKPEGREIIIGQLRDPERPFYDQPTADAAKSIWWKEPVYASIDGITVASDTPNRVCVDWKACKITDDDRDQLRKLKLSAQEACDEGLASIVDDRFQFTTHDASQA